MTRITIDTRPNSMGLFFVRHAGKSHGFKTLAEAHTQAEAIKARLGGNTVIKEVVEAVMKKTEQAPLPSVAEMAEVKFSEMMKKVNRMIEKGAQESAKVLEAGIIMPNGKAMRDNTAEENRAMIKAQMDFWAEMHRRYAESAQ